MDWPEKFWWVTPFGQKSCGRQQFFHILYWIAVLSVFVFFFIGCTYGIANVWQWGHNGFNGAAFAQAAKNSLRFDLLPQTPYYSGTEQPQPYTYYTDHPLMLHLHLIGIQWIGGDSEWVSRLVPAIYSFLTLLLVFLVGRRFAGHQVALLAITIYALTPHHLVFANMINHEQGGVFWCLAFVYYYLQWFRWPRRRYSIACFLSVTMAAQFDWPAYYLSFFVAIHALVVGIQRHPGIFRWRKEYSWVALFSAVVLANFIGYFWWIFLVRGSLHGMWGAFAWRSGSQPDYLHRQFAWAWELKGPVLLVLLGLWVVHVLFRGFRKKFGPMEIVASLFFVGQMIHSAVFQQAGNIHSYWTYYLGPSLALGGAWMIVDSTARLQNFWNRIVRRDSIVAGWTQRLLWGFMILGSAILLSWQLRFSIRQLHWGLLTGSASFVDNYEDKIDEQRWAHELRKLFGREKVHYLIHSSLKRWRLEFTHTLDASFSQVASLRIPQKGSTKKQVLLADLLHLSSRRKELEKLSGKVHIYIWNRRFMAVDSEEGTSGQITALLSRERPAPWWWKWLVHPEHPPVEWEADLYINTIERLFPPNAEPETTSMAGRQTGVFFEFHCLNGQVIQRLGLQAEQGEKSAVVKTIRPECRTIEIDSLDNRLEQLWLPSVIGPWIGWVTSDEMRSVRCHKGGVSVGIYGTSGALIDSVGLICQKWTVMQNGDRDPWSIHTLEEYFTPHIGGSGGASFEIRCPGGKVMTGIRGRSNHFLHALGLSCADPLSWFAYE